VTVNTTEGGAYGAALLASVGAGRWSSVEEACEKVIHIEEVMEPQAEKAEVYRALYPMYHNLYNVLKPTYNALAEYYRV
jgi:xylulokinase